MLLVCECVLRRWSFVIDHWSCHWSLVIGHLSACHSMFDWRCFANVSWICVPMHQYSSCAAVVCEKKNIKSHSQILSYAKIIQCYIRICCCVCICGINCCFRSKAIYDKRQERLTSQKRSFPHI